MKRLTLCFAALLAGICQPAPGAVSVVKLQASNAAAGDVFGTSAALDGSTLVVGAPGAGTVYVFTRQGANLWPEAAKLTVPGGPAQGFGHAVGVDGGTILVGAPGDSQAGPGAGAAYVFFRSGGVWSQQAKLLAGDAAAGQRFGTAVDLHEDTAIIGIRQIDPAAAGAVYTFRRGGSAWSEEQKLAPATPSAGFGQSVAVHGDLALVGDRSQQVAHAFARAAGVWSPDATLTPTAGSGDGFGNSVALSGTTAIVGAIAESQFAGAAYGFLREAAGWTEQDRLAAGAGVAGERFGISVAVDGDSAVIAGLGLQTVGQSMQTFLYLFQRDLDEWNEIGKETFDSGSLVATEESEFVGVSGCSAVAGTELDDQAAADAGAAHAVLLAECPCREPVTGLRAWWPLDEMASPAFDVEGDHHAQWLGDPTQVAGIVDHALELDGHDDHLIVPDHPALDFGAGDGFTLDAWVEPGDLGSVAGIVDKREPGGRGYSLRLENGRPAFVLSDGSGAATSVVAADSLPTGEWSFVAVSVDRAGDRGLLYVNGQVAASFVPGDLAPGDLANAAPLRIGTTGDDEPYQGTIDEVELFGRALSEAELGFLFQALSGGKCKPCVAPPPDLAGWWPLDETAGPLAGDVVGPNDGQWAGTPEPANGKVGGALRINSPDDRVAVADHPSLDFAAGDSLTLDAWIKPDEVDDLLAIIVSKWVPETRVGYRLFLRSGRVVFQMGDGTVAQVSYVSPNVISTTAWSLVAVTVDRVANEGRVWVNGTLDGTFTPSTAAPGGLANDAPLFIGGDASEDALPGRIDEVEIYRRALAEAEIHALYSAAAGGKCKPGAVEPAPPGKELDTGLIILALLLLVLVLLLLTRGKPAA